jgi:outer membrane lipopolysaccharide assembly protein LptE/RlpB
VIARDGGGKSAEARLTVTVNRNLFAPTFDPVQYTAEVKDNEPLMSNIVRVTAADADEQVSGSEHG